MQFTDITFNTDSRWPEFIGTATLCSLSERRVTGLKVGIAACNVMIANEQHKQYPSDLGMT